MSLTKAGRYQIIGELGHGAMGVVYRGFDPTIGRTVAIKTVLLDTGDPELIKRFRREAQAAGILSHPNIVTIYDAGEDNGVFYIAMELVEGETLQQIVARGPLPMDQMMAIAEQVSGALDHAHARQIIHRDIKPSNIMVTGDTAGDTAKVMDFGVAKITSMGMTSTGQVLGTPSYMSPELVKGANLDGRSDIFSLGVVLYEMVTGSKPFIGENITTVIYKIIGEQPEPPADINPALHPGLNYVVLKALAKNPADRYQNCAELVADLKNYRALSDQGKAAARAAMAAHTSAPRESSGTMVVARKDLGLPDTPGAPGRAGARNALLAAAGVAALVVGAAVTWKMWGGNAGLSAPPERIVVPAPAKPSPTLQPEAGGAAAPPASGPTTAPAPGTTTAPASGAASAAASPAPAPTEAAKAPPVVRKAPPASAPAGPGEVEFQVSASHNPATVRIDGKHRAETPHRFRLPVGRHTIEVQKDGFRTETREVEFTRKGPLSLMFSLAPNQAVVEIVSDPAGAELFVDGRRQATTPARVTFDYGERRVTVRKNGYRPVDRTVKVGENTPARIRIELDPEQPPPAQTAARPAAVTPTGGIGRIAVRTVPPGARVILDGKPTDYRTPVNFQVGAGKHKITVEHQGFPPKSADVVVQKDQTVQLDVGLGTEARKRRRFPLFR